MSRHKGRSESAARNAAGEFAIPFAVDMHRPLFHPRPRDDGQRQALRKLTKMGEGLAAGVAEAMQMPQKDSP